MRLVRKLPGILTFVWWGYCGGSLALIAIDELPSWQVPLCLVGIALPFFIPFLLLSSQEFHARHPRFTNISALIWGAIAAGGGCALTFYMPLALMFATGSTAIVGMIIFIAGVALLWIDAYTLFTTVREESRAIIPLPKKEEQIEEKYPNARFIEIGAILAIISGAIGLSLPYNLAGSLFGICLNLDVLTIGSERVLKVLKITISLIALGGGGYIWHNIRRRLRVKRIPAIAGGICAIISCPILGLPGLILIVIGLKPRE